MEAKRAIFQLNFREKKDLKKVIFLLFLRNNEAR
jgi:hypothetical protein